MEEIKKDFAAYMEACVTNANGMAQQQLVANSGAFFVASKALDSEDWQTHLNQAISRLENTVVDISEPAQKIVDALVRLPFHQVLLYIDHVRRNRVQA